MTPYTCGLDAAADVIGGKWKPRILWALHHGPMRFGELRREIAGVTEKMLIQQLRELESRDIVHREVFHQVPPRVEYSLTELGQSLNVALAPLDAWGAEYLGSSRPPSRLSGLDWVSPGSVAYTLSLALCSLCLVLPAAA